AAQRAAASLEIRAMPAERRADAVILVNATADKQRVHLRLTGVPDAAGAALFDVPFVDTASGDVAAALVEAQREPGGWTIDLDAGMSRQVWLVVQPAAGAKPGTYAGGKLTAKSDSGPQLDLPVRLRISPIAMPRPRLHLGRWH